MSTGIDLQFASPEGSNITNGLSIIKVKMVCNKILNLEMKGLLG